MNLLPCPFCGSSQLENLDGEYVRCIECRAKGPDAPNSVLAHRRWNTRAVMATAEQLPVHWQRGLGHMTWCGAAPEGIDVCRLVLNIRHVTCVQCLRQGYEALDARATELAAWGYTGKRPPETPDPPHPDPNPRSGTSVQCGPLTLNIPTGYEYSVKGDTLLIRSLDGKSRWALAWGVGVQASDPAFSFRT